MPLTLSLDRPHPDARRLRAMGLVLLLIATVIVGVIGMPRAAAAAELGPGYQEPGKPLNHLGGYRLPDGTIGYCIDTGLPSPLGAVTVDAGEVSQVNGLDPAAMLRLGVVLSRHGDTEDARTAAAVAIVVWSIADADRFAAAGGDARVLRRAPDTERAAISSLIEAFRAEAAAYRAPQPRVDLELLIDDHDERVGYLDVAVDPASSSVEVTLEGALFTAADVTSDGDDSLGTGESTSDARDGDRLRFALADPSPLGASRVDASPLVVSATSTDVVVSGLPSSAVRSFSTPHAQTLVAAGAPSESRAAGAGSDTRERRLPMLSTHAQAEGRPGGVVHDTAVLSGLPRAGVRLGFVGYLQPVGAGVPVCTDANAVFRSVPTIVHGDGEFSSPEFAVTDQQVGSVFWIATASTAEGVLLSQGACGDPREVTIIRAAPRLPVVSG